MTTDLQCFDFESDPVRVVERGGLPWFVAADICRVLDLSNPTMAIEALDDDEKTILSNTEGQAGRGAQCFNVISESGLYALVFKSRKPNARKFRKWVTAVVLPALRTDGQYVARAGEVETLSVLQFIEEHGAGWSLDREIEFGLKVRVYAKAMGVAYTQGSDRRFGRVACYPGALMSRVAGALRLMRGSEAYAAEARLLELIDQAALGPWEGTALELEEELCRRLGGEAERFCREHRVDRVLGRVGPDRVRSHRTRMQRRWRVDMPPRSE